MRFVLVGMVLIAVFGAAVASYGSYVSFGADSWVFQGGALLRAAFIMLVLIGSVVCFPVHNPVTLYTCNALGLVFGCVVIALRMTHGMDPSAEEASLFYVSRDGVTVLLVVALAQLILVPGWFALNATILSIALIVFLELVYITPGASENPLNLALTSIVAFAFVLGIGNAVQRLRRQAFVVHEQLRATNERLEQLARTDALTGCANRRHFFELGEVECKRSHRYHRPLSVIVMDVDHFKKINDRYGHAVGDRVLRAVANAVQKTLRQGEVLGRIGGEEFAFLLPETDTRGAAVVAERARYLIASLDSPTKDGKLNVTASFGVADNTVGIRNFDHLVNRADTMLYEAKNQGRNRVSLDEAARRNHEAISD